MTVPQRILSATERHGRFNRQIARRVFAKEAKRLTNEQFASNIMREAYRLAEEGRLIKKGRGEFVAY